MRFSLLPSDHDALFVLANNDKPVLSSICCRICLLHAISMDRRRLCSEYGKNSSRDRTRATREFTRTRLSIDENTRQTTGNNPRRDFRPKLKRKVIV